MKTRFPFLVNVILGFGVLLGILILQIEPQNTLEPGDQIRKSLSHNGGIARGPHGGWLFSDGNFQLEIIIYEKGIGEIIMQQSLFVV